MTEPTAPTTGTTMPTDLRTVALDALDQRTTTQEEQHDQLRAYHRANSAAKLKDAAARTLDNYADQLEPWGYDQRDRALAVHPDLPGILFSHRVHMGGGRTVLTASHDNGYSWQYVSELADLGTVVRRQTAAEAARREHTDDELAGHYGPDTDEENAR